MNLTPAQPNSSETPETLKAAAAQMLQGWFIGHTSGENCMNTLVDIFTEMREETEDAESIGKVVDAFLGPSIRQLETERNALRTELEQVRDFKAWCYTTVGSDSFDALRGLLSQGMEEHTQLQQSRAEVATLNGKLAAARS